jgi:hypothetical protein
MSNFFNPGSPKYRRGVLILSIYASTFVGFQMLIADYGTQEHVFSPVHRYIFPIVDKFYNLTEDEIRNKKIERSTSTIIPQLIWKVENSYPENKCSDISNDISISSNIDCKCCKK